MKPNIFSVSDSLKINEFKLNKKFDILITNPPFGKNKYKFADEIKENFPMEFLKKSIAILKITIKEDITKI